MSLRKFVRESVRDDTESCDLALEAIARESGAGARLDFLRLHFVRTSKAEENWWISGMPEADLSDGLEVWQRGGLY